MASNRDLDAEVAKVILGWKLIGKVGKDYYGKNEGMILLPYDGYADDIAYPPTGKLHEAWLVPNYSGRLDLALELARKVKLPILAYEMPQDREAPEKITRMCLEH